MHGADLHDWIERIEDWPAGRFRGAAALAVAAPLLGTFAVIGVADALLAGIAALAAAGAGWLGWRRRQIATLPLEISRNALVQVIGHTPVYRFRVRLGRGRRMTDAHADVLFRDEAGEVRLEPVLAGARVLLGPWTLVVSDPERRCDGPGTFIVRVRAREGEREWTAEAHWARDAVREGRFAPGLRVDGGVRWVGRGWDRVEA